MPPTWKWRRSAPVSKPFAVSGSTAWRVSTVSIGQAPGSEEVVAARREGVDQDPRLAEGAAGMRGARRDDEGVAGTDQEGLAGDGELEMPGFHERRLHVRVAVRRADAVGGEG